MEGREPADDLAGLANHLETTLLSLAQQVEARQQAAAAELDRRESAWRPVAVRLAAWLERGRAAVQHRVDVSDFDTAERWLKGMSEQIRDERFAPIAHHAQQIWRTPRLRSNVELGGVKLKGTATQRRVSLDVTIDGVPGAALSVTSQGELHALALSLFLPRATLEDSAFRFVVIDDPVQSMDPARVDGLARVLEEAAVNRQVVVFTHDDRLAESVRRLGVPARVLEVTRAPGSAVEVLPRLDPVERYLDDARAVASTEGLPERLAGSVVPGLCRMALEAACMEAVRRRRLQRGQRHAEVEQALLAAEKLTTLTALALFDDLSRGGDVLGRLNAFGRWAADVFQACNQGSHIGYEGDLSGLIRDAGRLATELRKRP